MQNAHTAFGKIDLALTRWMAQHGITLLRISLGVIFFWFGVLKFFPGLSPAQDLAARTIGAMSFGLLSASISLPVLAAWECLIGLGFITGKFMRATLLLLVMQMAGTLTPLLLFPSETFTQFPIAPTLEGQYIIKNMVLIASGLVIGATVRGGYLLAQPGDCR